MLSGRAASARTLTTYYLLLTTYYLLLTTYYLLLTEQPVLARTAVGTQRAQSATRARARSRHEGEAERVAQLVPHLGC
jgi:hypothetical protein